MGRENIVYTHTKEYFSCIEAMKFCCLHNGEGTGRHSVKWDTKHRTNTAWSHS